MATLNIAFEVPQTSSFRVNEFRRQMNEYAKTLIDKFNSQKEKNDMPKGHKVLSYRELSPEIQALVGTTPYPAPRRVANGVDLSRLLQILAVLEKRIGLNLSKQDVYVNVIGGMDVTEPAADLGIALAIITCVRDVVMDSGTAIIGEIGLSGEIRGVNNIERRITEAKKLGFKRIIIPDANELQEPIKGIEIIKVKRIIEAITKSVSK